MIRPFASALVLALAYSAIGGVEAQETIETPVAGAQPPLGLTRPIREMAELGVDIGVSDDELPRDFAAELAAQMPLPNPPVGVREWPHLTYEWTASGSRSYPLRFEEVNAERYGYGCRPCLQPAVSFAHFFGTIPLLPYQMAVDCPRECQYTLGHYRPGSCSPWRRQRCPWQINGAVAQGAAVAGLIFLLP